MHHDHNLLTIRVLTIASVVLAIVAGLSMFETNKIDNLSTTRKLINPSSTPNVAAKEASGSVQVVGPGDCLGIDQCLKYCQDHPSECAKK